MALCPGLCSAGTPGGGGGGGGHSHTTHTHRCNTLFGYHGHVCWVQDIACQHGVERFKEQMVGTSTFQEQGPLQGLLDSGGGEGERRRGEGREEGGVRPQRQLIGRKRSRISEQKYIHIAPPNNSRECIRPTHPLQCTFHWPPKTSVELSTSGEACCRGGPAPGCTAQPGSGRTCGRHGTSASVEVA